MDQQRPLGLTPNGVLWFGIAVAGRPREHRHMQLEFEEVLLRTRRGNGGVALGSELLCQPTPELRMQDVAGGPAQIERVFVIFHGKRVHRVSPIAMEVPLLWRRDNECVQPNVGEQRAHRMQSGPAVSPHCAEERQAETKVIQELASLTGKVGLLGFEVSPRDHVE